MSYKRSIVRNGGDIVSDGTLRSADLLHNFCDALWSLGKKQRSNELRKEGKAALDLIDLLEEGFFKNILSPDETKQIEEAYEALAWIINVDLYDELNENAPKGYYFDASDGDGACFGFWKEDREG